MTNSAAAEELIKSVERADSSARLVAAVRALADARLEAGVPTLIAVLGYNNPEAAVIAVDGLIQLGEVVVPTLLKQLDDYNYGARAYSFRVLAAIADPQALDVLLTTAESDFAPSVRRAAAKGLGNLHWVKLPEAEREIAQTRALSTLLLLSSDADWAIRYAAVVGLQALAVSEPAIRADLIHQILERFAQIAQTDPDLAVKARVWMANEQLPTNSTQLKAFSY